MNKGQVTIFIIAGMVIFILFVLILSVVPKLANNYRDTPVDGYMQECLEMEGRYIFQELGRTGARFDNSTYNSSYLLRGSNKYLPTLADINLNLKERFNKSIQRCVNNYVGSEEITRLKPGYEFTYSEDSVTINIEKPYKVKTQKRTIYKNMIPMELDIRLKRLLELINSTLDDYATHGQIYEDHMLAETGFEVYVKKKGSDRLWLIKDAKSIEYNRPYIFRFVVEK